ncbi:hypothetical protein ABW19_dt0201719 [Dactylella cylindrospora]|nr:hypothetical protein ABW19_dt0201719 [Dactylella cylindrospora]
MSLHLVMLPSLFALSLLIPIITAQIPTAVVSIVSDPDYVTARPCIQHCVWYNGGLGRGGNSGFDDVGKALGCGQFPINACYCSSRLTSSATSYFTTCISQYCTVTDPADLSTALSLYGRYCATANVAEAVTTSSSESSSESSSSSASQSRQSSSPSTSSTSSSSAPTDSSESQSPSSSPATTPAPANTNTGITQPPSASESSSSGGLSSTSKIALGVGLGVGIPVLALLGAIFFMLLRRGRSEAGSGLGGIESK